MKIIVEILIIFVLILINGFLAMSEMAVISSSLVRLRLGAAEGKSGYKIALDLANKPGHFLSSVQIGITLMGILAGAFGGATLARVLGEIFVGLGLAAGVSEAIGVTIVVVIITYFSLVMGELVPKRIALLNPERVASIAARPIGFISHIFFPLERLLSHSTSFVLKFLGLQPNTEPAITEEEVKLLVDQGTEIGIFEPIVDTIVDNVFRLGDQPVESIATPRTETIWFDLDDPPSLSIEKIKDLDHPYFPVAQGTLDNPLGFVKTNDLLTQSLEEGVINLEKSILQPFFIPENIHVFSALEKMRESGYRIAFVMDEYSGIQGVVTFRDLLEGLIGEIPLSHEIQDPDVVRLEDGSYLLDGKIPIQQFRELFKLAELPGEKENYYQTLAGFVLHLFGYFPKTGENMQWEGYHFEIINMDNMRLDKVKIIPPGEG